MGFSVDVDFPRIGVKAEGCGYWMIWKEQVQFPKKWLTCVAEHGLVSRSPGTDCAPDASRVQDAGRSQKHMAGSHCHFDRHFPAVRGHGASVGCRTSSPVSCSDILPIFKIGFFVFSHC